jgi:hypothetical protein
LSIIKLIRGSRMFLKGQEKVQILWEGSSSLSFFGKRIKGEGTAGSHLDLVDLGEGGP